MEKIKDLKKSIIHPGTVLVEIIEPKRLILRPDGAQDHDSYAKIIKVHETVTDLEEGDLVIKYSGTLHGYSIKSAISDKERMIAVMHRGSIEVAVKPDNFIDPDKMAGSLNV